ncbi:MAG: nuclear transport factor 2 family protein [Nitrososphaera sp.]|jgi:hypothetical protein
MEEQQQVHELAQSRIHTGRQLVKEYFRRIAENSKSTLALFADDAILYEPFSTKKSLRGKGAIEDFLQVARMANRGLQKKIYFIAQSKNAIEVIVEFTRGGTVKGRFQFRTEGQQTPEGTEKKIKELKIQFMR